MCTIFKTCMYSEGILTRIGVNSIVAYLGLVSEFVGRPNQRLNPPYVFFANM